MKDLWALEKGIRLESGEGVALFATDEPDLAILEWESEERSRLASALHETLRRHAVLDNVVASHGSRGLVVHRLALWPMNVRVSAAGGDTVAQYFDPGGRALTKEEILALPGMRKKKLALVEDIALQTARSLRAHVAVAGGTDVELDLSFGLCADGRTLVKALDPVDCRLGNLSADDLLQALGGDKS